MPESIDSVTQKLIDDIDAADDLEKKSTAVKNLKTLAEAKKLLEEDPTPDPEPTGIKAWMKDHSGDLIKVGGSFLIVATIAVIEAKGDVIFRSKASKFI